jgi:predicted lipoprotein with Yx(FWY)xxD motif
MKNIFFTLITTAFFLQGCSKDSNPDPIVDPTPDPTPVVSSIKLAENPTFGKILTDTDGRSLYFFSLDTKDNSACLDGCLTVWPVFYKASITVDAGLQAADFTTIDRPDGTKQTSYKGWPLYYYANDVTAGDTNGDKVNNTWYIAKPDYSLMYVSAQLLGHDGKNYLDDYTEGEGASFYLTDISGKTLYSFSNDTKNTNNFTNPDFSNNAVWPIAEINLNKIPSILNPADFGSIDVFGKTQLTYKGWPLYYFGQDTARGDNKGISFPAPGVWPIVNTASPLAPEPASTLKLTVNGTFGTILTDGDGNSLYFFGMDTKETSACTTGCLSTWPVFYEANIVTDAGLDPMDFATINRSDGAKQTTYKGWPLYYFAGDIASGDTNGDGINDLWYIAKPDYSLMYVQAQLVGHDGKNYLGDYSEGDGATFYITDIAGRTLYSFIADTKDTNNYTSPDFSNDPIWPIAEITLENLPSILDATDFGTIDVFGRTQLTYRGRPMYYFGQDVVRGDNKGISFPSPGVWPILNTDTLPLTL